MIEVLIKRSLPASIQNIFGRHTTSKVTNLPKASQSRQESNNWLKYHAADIEGRVLSIGSDTDEDSNGGQYRDYFKKCSSYTTSEATSEFNVDLVIDVRSMPQIRDNSFDCIFCSGVLEHVDDYQAGLKEIARILRQNGILLLGLPFRQAIHMAPNDYWRFTEHGLRYMLRDNYEILELKSVDNSVPDFPAAYWLKARKR